MRYLLPDVGVELIELGQVGVEVGHDTPRVVGVLGGKMVRDVLGGVLPERDVEPDVRVVVAFELGRLVEAGLRGSTPPPEKSAYRSGEALEDVGHAAFEVEAVVEDHVGVLQRSTSPALGL